LEAILDRATGPLNDAGHNIKPPVMWTLHVLGPVRLTAADGTDVARLGTKTEAVLIYLAVHAGKPASRRALIELIWPDRSGDEARNAFRQWLFDFRRRFGEDALLRTEGELLRIDSGVCVTDLALFHALAHSDNPADWAEACEAYTGALADKLSVTTEFDHWLAGHRELVCGAARELLGRMAAEETAASANAACTLARVLIADDPLDEAAYRALMRLQEAAGQRAKAAETWIACRRALMAEVGAQPSAATCALHERIQRGTAAGVASGPVLRVLPAAPPPVRPGSDEASAAAADYMQHGQEMMINILCSDAYNGEARAAFQAAAALCPHEAAPPWMVARAHFNDFVFGWNGDPLAHYQASLAIIDRLRREHPKDDLVRGMSARLQIWRREHEAAHAELRPVLARSEHPWLMLVMAEVLMYAGRYAEAIVLARRAREAEPSNLAMFRSVEGMARFGQGDLEGARLVLSSALRRHPRHCVSWATLAAVHAELGDVDAARAAARAARGNNSRYSLSFARDVMPFADAAVRARWVKAWATAGMPAAEGALEPSEAEWTAPARAAVHPVFNAIVA
jgi:DNA-binding SARP family transcriptional activator/Flp pilus assembly protein TadD